MTAIAELLRDELTLSPARTARMLRMTAIVALVVIISLAMHVPDAAVSAYMIFFFAKRDVATTLVSGIGAVVGLTVAVGLCFICFVLTVAEPAVRLPLMVLLAFGGVYLMRATPAGPLGLLAGFIAFYMLTLPDQLPSPEVLVRALLWIWVVIAYPIGLLVLVDLAFGARPAEVYRSGIAEGLAAAAEFLAASPQRGAKGTARLRRYMRLGASDLLDYVPGAGPVAMAPVRGALLRQSELLGFLLHQLPESVRRDPAVLPALQRAGVACEAAGDVLEGRDDSMRGHFDLLAAERRAVDAMTPSSRAIVRSLVTCVQTISLSVQELSRAPRDPAPSFLPPKHHLKVDTTEAVRFATKVTMAAMAAYLLYSGLEWYGIHTATITCFFIARESVGATIHRSALRLSGAMVGAALGMLSILFVLPAFESVGGLVVLIAAVTLLAAWVGTGSERISYAGWQIAFAFYLSVLQGFSRTSKLSVGRDRVVGILLGNILMSVIFTSLWPVRAAPAQRQSLARVVEAMEAMLLTAPDDRDALNRAEADFYVHLKSARAYASLLPFERSRDDRGLLVTVVQGLFIPIHAMVRTPVPATASPAARAALSRVGRSVSDWLRAYASSIRDAEASMAQAQAQASPGSDLVLATLANDADESPETRARLVDQVGWLELLRAQSVTLAERFAT